MELWLQHDSTRMTRAFGGKNSYCRFSIISILEPPNASRQLASPSPSAANLQRFFADPARGVRQRERA